MGGGFGLRERQRREVTHAGGPMDRPLNLRGSRNSGSCCFFLGTMTKRRRMPGMRATFHPWVNRKSHFQNPLNRL